MIGFLKNYVVEELEFDVQRPEGPIGKLPPQPWMAADETKRVMTALAKGGTEPRFIGGCVRDAILKRPVQDIDIATPEPPETAMKLLEDAEIRVLPTGIDHGTVTAVLEAMRFEITTLRVDVETDGRHARVAFTNDWMADAARRDFTINALSCSVEGDVYDYFGGLDDLGRGRVRFIGRPEERIAEDALRLLRFFRFFAWYGKPPADKLSLEACRVAARKLEILSGERVRAETFRTLMAEEPASVFNLMRGLGVLEPFLPEAGDVAELRIMSWLDTRAIRVESVRPDPVRRLAALLDTDAVGAEAAGRRLKLSNHDQSRLVGMASGTWRPTPETEEKALFRQLRQAGAEAFRDGLLLAWAEELAVSESRSSARTARWMELLALVDEWRAPEFPLRGRDVLDLGIAAGPEVGRALKAAEDWWEGKGYAPDRDACLAWLKARERPA